MAQTTTSFTPVTPNYITPISCPRCAANAHLIRRAPSLTGDGNVEIRTFECTDCKGLTEMLVRD